MARKSHDTSHVYADVVNSLIQGPSLEREKYMHIDKLQYIIDEVDKVHQHPISPKNKANPDGRWRTRLDDGTDLQGAKEMVYLRLYELYYKHLSFEEIWNSLVSYWESKNCMRKTILAYKNDYHKFFSSKELVQKDLRSITVKDLTDFLKECHSEPLIYQRHSAIKFIIESVYAHSSDILADPVPCPMGFVKYNNKVDYPTKKSKEKRPYSEKERTAILSYIYSLKSPTLPELVIAFIFETSARNGEARALRFDSYHIEEGYVRIDGLEGGYGQREERIKCGSETGKGNYKLTPKLLWIYEKAKELSWSDEYLFVTPKCYAKNGRVIMSEKAPNRALKKICDELGIDYRSLHQIRFSNATQMAKDGATASEIQRMLRHSTPTMALHYVRKAELDAPIPCMNNDEIMAQEFDPKKGCFDPRFLKSKNSESRNIIAFPSLKGRGASRI